MYIGQLQLYLLYVYIHSDLTIIARMFTTTIIITGKHHALQAIHPLLEIY